MAGSSNLGTSGSWGPELSATSHLPIAIMVYRYQDFLLKFYDRKPLLVSCRADGQSALGELENYKRENELARVLVFGCELHVTCFELVKRAMEIKESPSMIISTNFENVVDANCINKKPKKDRKGSRILVLTESKIFERTVGRMLNYCFDVVRCKEASKMKLDKKTILVLVDSGMFDKEVASVLEDKEMPFVVVWDGVEAIDMEWITGSKLMMIIHKPLEDMYKPFLEALALTLAK